MARRDDPAGGDDRTGIRPVTAADRFSGPSPLMIFRRTRTSCRMARARAARRSNRPAFSVASWSGVRVFM